MNCFIDQESISNNSSWLLEISITFLAFLLGLISTIIINRFSERKKRKRLKEFYLSWIEFSLEAFDRQIILFNEYINEISNKKSIRLKFNNNQIDKLNDLNNEELFDAFVISNKGNTKLNSENLHKLGSHISYLEISIQNIKEKFNEFREENKNWTEHWNTSFLEFGKIIMDYITKHKRNYGKNIEDIFLLKEKLNELGKTDQVPSEVVFNEFITPIRKIFSHHLNLNHDDISLNGIKSSERLNALILQKNHLYKTHIEGIEDYKKQISYTLEKSKEIVEYFKNQ